MGFPLLYYNLYHPEASSQQEQPVKGMAEVSTWRPSFYKNKVYSERCSAYFKASTFMWCCSFDRETM